MRLFLRPLSNLKISTPNFGKQIICRGIAQNTARTLQRKLRSATITIDFLNLIVRKIAINAQIAYNTSANAVISGVVKLLDILKITQQACLAVVLYPMRSLFSGIRQQRVLFGFINGVDDVLLSTRLEKFQAQGSENPLCSIPVKSSNQTSTSPSRPPAPVTSDQPSNSTPLFGLLAVTIPATSAKPESQLQNRNILWTSIISAGEGRPLQLESCLSRVSEVHADFVASRRPDLKHCFLEEPISVTAADP